MKKSSKQQLSMKQHKAISLLLLKDVKELNYQQIAEKVGISERTLARWRKRKDFTDELTKQAEQFHKTFIVETYMELRRLIFSPDVADGHRLKAIELMLKNQGRLTGVKETTVNIDENSKSFAEMLAELDAM